MSNKRFVMEIIHTERPLNTPFLWTFAIPEYEYRAVRGFVNQDGKYIVHDVYAKDNKAYGVRITAMANDVANPIRMLREAETLFDEIMVAGGIDEWEQRQSAGTQDECGDQPDPVQARPVGESEGEAQGDHTQDPNTESPIHDSGEGCRESPQTSSNGSAERGQGDDKAGVGKRDSKGSGRGKGKRNKATDND